MRLGASCLQLEAKKLLFDIREAAQLVARFVAGRTYLDYLDDAMLRSAVERQLEIVGEAVGKLSKIAPEVADKIPHSPRIVAFRNVLAHGYGAVAHDVVWGVVENRLGPLIATVESLLPPET